jgi:hypothetical protein
MPGSVIGKSLLSGFAGTYARTPDIIVTTKRNNGTVPLLFGLACQIDSSGGVLPIQPTFAADEFAGVVAAEAKTNTSFISGDVGGTYAPNEPTAVFQRGKISVVCANGDPAPNGPVYVCVASGLSRPVGSFEAVADPPNNVLVPGLQWQNVADGTGVATLVILNQINA